MITPLYEREEKQIKFKGMKGKLAIRKTGWSNKVKRTWDNPWARLTFSKAQSHQGFEEGVLGHPIGGVPPSTPYSTPVVFGLYNRVLANLSSDEFIAYHLKYDYQPVGIDYKTWDKFKKKIKQVGADFHNRHFTRERVADDCDPLGFIRRFTNREQMYFGFDTEWQDRVVNGENVSIPLSYQFSTTLDGVRYDFVFYTEHYSTSPDKFKLVEMLYHIVANYFKGFGCIIFEASKSHHKNSYYESITINLISHFGGVDYFMCDDYDALYEFDSLTYKEQQKVAEGNEAVDALYEKAKTAGRELSDSEMRDIEIIEAEVEEVVSKARHTNNLINSDKHCLMTTSPRVYNFWIRPRRLRCEFKLNLRDTMKLSPPKAPLSTLGEALNIPKLDTELFDVRDGYKKGFYKSHMKALLLNRPEFFEEYAVRDARISHEWYKSVLDTLGEDGVTISAIAGSLLVQEAKHIATEIEGKEDFSYNRDVRGFSVDDEGADYGAYHYSRMIFGEMPNKAYHGGRNESFTHGLHSEKSLDYDLRSAYPLGMQTIPEIDFTKNPIVFEKGHALTIDDWKHVSQAGFGHVKFEFPKNVSYPSIPLKSDKNGLKGSPVFLSSGEGLVCAPDVYAALIMGAKVIVTDKKFMLFDVKTDDEGNIEEHMLGKAIRRLVKQRAEMRRKFGKGSVQEQLLKIVCNSIYGKTGQGIHGNTARNIITDDMENIPFSRITDGVMASTITAVVRQMLGFIMHFIDQAGYKVYSVTTDGFISNFPPERQCEIDDYLATISPVYREVLEKCWNDADGSVLEVKHVNHRGFFNIKTRGNIGFDDGSVFASAGYTGDEVYRGLPSSEQARYLLDLVLNRDGRIEDYKTSMLSFRDVKDGNIKSIQKFYSSIDERIKGLSMDYDKKRCLLPRVYSTIDIEFADKRFKSDYGYFMTRPFRDMAEYEHSANVHTDFISIGHNIKTDEDLEAFEVGKNIGFPKFKSEKDNRLTTKQRKEKREEFAKYKIRQFLILLLLHDEYIKSPELAKYGYQRKDYIQMLEDIYTVSETEILNMWKNIKRLKNSKKGYTLDLLHARNTYSDIVSMHYFYSYMEKECVL